MSKAKIMSMVFNILAKKEGDIWLGHCLELDIVATAESFNMLRKDMEDLILAQVDYAFTNDNLEHLYRPAPPEVWKEFYQCQDQIEDTIDVKTALGNERSLERFVPPWIIAKTCFAEGTSVV